MSTWTVATIAAAYLLIVLRGSSSSILLVGGSPCDWDFTVNGEPWAYAFSMIFQPDGSSFSTTGTDACSCSSSSSSSTGVCENDTIPDTGGVLQIGWDVNDEYNDGNVYLNFTDDRRRMSPLGPSVTNESDRCIGSIGSSCFAVEPIPGPTVLFLSKTSDSIMVSFDDYGHGTLSSQTFEVYALPTVVEYLFDNGTERLNGVRCVGMAGHIKVTTLDEDLRPLREMEVDFECPAGAFPTCETICLVEVNDGEEPATLNSYSSSIIWETDKGLTCYAAGDADEYRGIQWSFPYNWEHSGSKYVDSPCGTLPDDAVRRVSVSSGIVIVQVSFLTILIVLCVYTILGLCVCGCLLDFLGCCEPNVKAALRYIEWPVSLCDTGCEVCAIVGMVSSIYYCGINEFCNDDSAGAITLVMLGQAIPLTLSVVVVVREAIGQKRSRPEAIGKSMKYLLRITDPKTSYLRALIAVVVPSALAIGAYLILSDRALTALPVTLAVLVGIGTIALVKGGEASAELSGLFLTYICVDWMTVTNALGLPSAMGEASPTLAMVSKTLTLILAFTVKCFLDDES